MYCFYCFVEKPKTIFHSMETSAQDMKTDYLSPDSYAHYLLYCIYRRFCVKIAKLLSHGWVTVIKETKTVIFFVLCIFLGVSWISIKRSWWQMRSVMNTPSYKRSTPPLQTEMEPNTWQEHWTGMEQEFVQYFFIFRYSFCHCFFI